MSPWHDLEYRIEKLEIRVETLEKLEKLANQLLMALPAKKRPYPVTTPEPCGRDVMPNSPNLNSSLVLGTCELGQGHEGPCRVGRWVSGQ